MPNDRDILESIAGIDILRDVCLGRPTGNEENIKVKVVTPLLLRLGYDRIRDLDFERHVARGRPDIVVLVNGKPRLIVEAKGLDKDLSEFKLQGLEYAHNAGIPWTILTNGLQWDLYKTFIEGVSPEENEPIVSLRSKDLVSDFRRLEELVSKTAIKTIDASSDNQVKRVARKAKVADLARIIQRFRTGIFFQLREQFEAQFDKDAGFTEKVSRWVSEQGVDRDYDWFSEFSSDKRFRAYALSIMQHAGLPGTRKDFEAVYRRKGHDETTARADIALRHEGIPVDWPDKLCLEGTYSLVNRLLFLRICEDAGFVAREVTSDFTKKLRGSRDNEELVARLDAAFASMRSSYPGVYKLPLLDHLHLSELKWDKDAIADLCDETRQYNFSELGDVLGELYQRHVDYNARRLIGQFYTHEEKVEFILDSISDWLTEGNRVLDPACGSGTFLVGAYRRLAPQLVASGYSKSTAHRQLLEEVLCGVDIDSFAAQLTAINLLVRDMEQPVGNLHLYVGNSLATDETLVRFGLEVPAVNGSPDPRGPRVADSAQNLLVDRSFDVIVGNPPFFRVGLANPVYGHLLKSGKYAPIRPSGAEMNMATLFLKRSIDLLKERATAPENRGGVCALIMPKSITYVDEYRLIREYLLDKARFLTIVDLGRGWEDVGLEQVMLIFERRALGTGEAALATATEEPVQVISDVRSLRRRLYARHVVRSGVFSNDSRHRFLLYVSGPAEGIRSKMLRAGTPLHKFKTMIWEGIRDDYGVTLFKDRQNPRSVPLLKGSSVRRWFMEPEAYVDSTDPRVPKSIREKCDVQKKIVIKRVLSSKVRVEAIVDDTHAITHSSTTSLTFRDGTDPEYVVGILNSRLANLFVRDWMFNRTELTMNFRAEYLGEIPVPRKPPSELKERIIKSVAKLRELSSTTASGAPLSDRMSNSLVDEKAVLDTAVYELFGLNHEESLEVERLMPYSD